MSDTAPDPTSAPKAPATTRSWKPVAIGFLILVIGAGAAAAWAYGILRQYAHRPKLSVATPRTMDIEPGEDLPAVADRLVAAGLIDHPMKFRLLARFLHEDTTIKAGEYELSAAMAPAKILSILVSGKVKLHRLTIPEGFDLMEIAEAVARAGLSSKEAFLAAASDRRLLARYGIDAANAEGFLFPDTYYFPKNTPPKTIVQTMLARFNQEFSAAWRKRAKELGWTIREVVTLASIIEKETGDPTERPLISSVFYNRLRRHMRLQSDPTVIYGIPNFDGDLTRKNLTTPTPYNTYTIQGLPPGPITNPGKASLEAALYPAHTDYLYFVSRENSTHQFSTNIADHDRAVRKYQLHR